MAVTAKCLYDKEGAFTSGESYPVLAFGEAGAVVKDDNGKPSHIGYSTFNNDEAWTISYDDEKKAKPEPKTSAQ